MEVTFPRNQGSDLPSDAAASAFAALGSPLRLLILRALVRAGRGGLAVGELQRRVGIPASTLSHHLRALVQAGVVEQRRHGRTLVCHADFARVEALARFLLAECCAEPACTPAESEREHS